MSSEILTCQVCGSTSSNPLFPQRHPGLRQCTACGFAWFNRIPSPAELVAHYNTYPRLDEISAITLKRFDELLEEFEPWRKENRILDVGCGNGHLLQAARTKNWQVFGTEFTDEAVNICAAKGISMQQGELNEQNYTPGSFDIICFIEVIEHIQHVREELKKFHSLLRRGGMLYITTPNFKALSGRLAGEKWNIIEYPEHLSYFGTSTLHRILTDSGFRKCSLVTTGFSYNRLNTSRSPGIPKENVDEKLRIKSETKPLYKLAKKIVNTLLTQTGTGDTIKAIYQKE